MSAEIVVHVHIECLPGRGDEQVEAFRRLAPLVRAEDGCLQYDLHRVEGDADRFVLIERWAGDAELAAHHEQPHMADAAAENRTFRAGPASAVRIAPEPVG
jgi:quinol monooxygenase YgiN